jgi:hypothetical protein
MAKKTRSIFRKQALERLESPEQLDRLIRITNPRGWLALIGLALLIGIATVWAVFGRVTQSESAQGILIREGGVQVIPATVAGQVRAVEVAVGDVVSDGHRAIELRPYTGIGRDSDFRPPETIVVRSPQGRIVDVLVQPGDLVEAGAPLLRLEAVDSPLEAVGYLAIDAGSKVQPGMGVHISPVWAKQEEYGFLLGRVRSVSRFPATHEGMMRVLGDARLVESLSGGGPVIEIFVELTADENSLSGYRWSNPTGEALDLHSGIPCTLTVVTGQQRPIAALFPILDD